MATTIKFKRGTTLPSSGLEVGEPLFVTSNGSEALHIAKSSSETVRIGPVELSASALTNSTIPLERIYMKLLGTTQWCSVLQTTPLTSVFVTHTDTRQTGLSFTHGELVIGEGTLLANESAHYADSYNSSTGEVNVHAYINLMSSYTAPGSSTPINSSNLLYSSTATTDEAQYYNQLPPVDGTLLSTGHLDTAAQTGIACPIKATGSGSSMKLYADVPSQSYSAGDDISISNNTINAKDQISFIPANVAYDSIANNIVYTQQNASGKCRRNYSKYTIEENEVGNTWTLNLKFDINDLNVECFLILHHNINKLQISSKPKIFYRGDEIKTYYNNWSIIANQQAGLGTCYRIEVVVSKNTTGDIYAVLTVTEINYD